MAILGEIRKRSWLLLGVIALGLFAFLFNADTFDKIFEKNPNIFGKVNGEFQPAGVYVWSFQAFDEKTQKSVIRKGVITLIR